MKMIIKYLTAVFLLLPMSEAMDYSRDEKSVKAHRSSFTNHEENTAALNRFLENVLKAKDQLKWIDKTVYQRSVDNDYISQDRKRRLLWLDKKVKSPVKKKRRDSRNVEIPERIADDGKLSSNSEDLDAANEEGIDTILDSLGFSSDNKPSENLVKNIRVERRHYPVSDLTDSGIIEYYDYDAGIEKRDSSNTFNSTSTSLEFNTTTIEPKKEFLKQEFINDNASAPQVKTFLIDPAELEDDDQEIIPLENMNKIKGNYFKGVENKENHSGRQARYHNEEKSGEQEGVLLHSRFIEIDEFEIIPDTFKPIPNEINSKITKPRCRKNIKRDKKYFLLVPSTSFDTKNKSNLSGSNYHALKSTDDLFKGGIEQGNLVQNDIKDQEKNRLDNKFHLFHEKSDREKIGYGDNPDGLDALNMKKDSREKRSNGHLGPVMRQESVVEQSNFPWSDYNLKDNLHLQFGRELMQVSEDENDLSMETEDEELDTKKIQDEDIFSDSQVHFYPGENTYLHRRHKDFAKNRKSFVNKKKKNSISRSSRSLNLDRVEKQSNGGRLTDMLKGDKLDDNSQISITHGIQTLDKIINQIFQQVHNNKKLKTKLVPNLQEPPKIQDISMTEKNPDSRNQEQVKHTEEIIKKVTEFLEQFVSHEASRKACTMLPHDLQIFLNWMVKDNDNSRDSGNHEGPKSPQYHQDTKEPAEPGKPNATFLFPTSPRPYSDTIEGRDLLKKVRLLEGLLEEYHSLTEKEQTKVQTVYEYLERQLILLLKFIESKNKAKDRISSPATIKKSVDELQYRRNVQRGNEDDMFLDESKMNSRRQKRHTRSEKRKLKLSKNNQATLLDNRMKKIHSIDQNLNVFTPENPTTFNSLQNDFPINASNTCNHSLNQGYCSTTCRSESFDNFLEKKFQDNEDSEGGDLLTIKSDVANLAVEVHATGTETSLLTQRSAEALKKKINVYSL